MPALAPADVPADPPDPPWLARSPPPLPAVLGLVVLGLLQGRKRLAGIARLGRRSGFPLAQALGFRRGKAPAKSTPSEVLRALGPQAVEDAPSRWVASRPPEGLDRFSFDGKALRGGRDGEVPGRHLAAAYAPQAEAVRAPLRVDAHTNEHWDARPFNNRTALGKELGIASAFSLHRAVAAPPMGSSRRPAGRGQTPALACHHILPRTRPL